jgi:hypothetical protein
MRCVSGDQLISIGEAKCLGGKVKGPSPYRRRRVMVVAWAVKLLLALIWGRRTRRPRCCVVGDR